MILALSGFFPVEMLCDIMNIPRSSFYTWKHTLFEPSGRAKAFTANVMLFSKYHRLYPSHGYRWLNAKIALDTGNVMSPAYAHKCCKTAGIKSQSKRCACKYKKPGNPYRLFPNLLLAGLPITGPMQCVVSDMTAFSYKGKYYELTLYMDLWNNEIVSHALSSRRGDRMTYINGLEGLLKRKEGNWRMVLHSDQGSVYASERFNDILALNHISHSMSRAGTPTDNAAMEAINGWLKAELFTDFHLTGEDSVEREIERYIKFFNEERPAYALGYRTPKQYREEYAQSISNSEQESTSISTD